VKHDLTDILTQIKKSERIENYETIRIGKYGNRINISVTISPIKDEGGKIIGASAIARDITEQKLYEAERIKKEQQLSQA